MSSSGDRVHGTTNVVEYSVVGPKVGNYVKLLACAHNKVLDILTWIKNHAKLFC